ncbi:MAG: hypothetical protein IK115_08520 [Lachnospiraceae bacterium]|nr:hypothetical protein [Lachnospiraceae bacterium]
MIIFDARRVKAYERLKELAALCGRDEAYREELWEELLKDAGLMGAFMYYLDEKSLYDGVSCEGYGLTDVYFYQLRRFDVSKDIGKNSPECAKDALVLDSFLFMARMKREPEKYVRLLDSGPGMDVF